MQQVQLTDQLYRVAQRRASEAGFASVEEYIADVVTHDVADDTENFDHLFTPQVISELDQISAAAKAGGKTYTSEEVREHFRKKSDAWLAEGDSLPITPPSTAKPSAFVDAVADKFRKQ